jgi:sulfide:quinone oxidoreductase
VTSDGPLDGVFAAGDGTSFPIKQGGLAAQQADAAAEAIAAAAGAEVEQRGFHPVLRGILLTDSGPKWLRANVGGAGATSELAEHALWWPPTKVAGRRLGPYLWRREEGEELQTPHDGGVTVDHPLPPDPLPRPRRRLTLGADGPEGRLELLEVDPGAGA